MPAPEGTPAARRSPARLTAILAASMVLGALATIPLAPVHVRAAGTVGGTYHPLTPARILDTRSGTGGFSSPIAQNASIDVQVGGQGGVPLTSVSAVVINVTVTNTTFGSFLTVYPTGVARPVASNLNWVTGQTVPNLVTVGLGTGGKVTAYNGVGAVDVVFDVEGYYTDSLSSPGPDGLFNPLVPARLLDTRNGTGAPVGKLGNAASIDLPITGRGGVPASGVSAVVLNVTVTGPDSPSYLTVFPTGVTKPVASNLNFRPGQTVPNRVMVGVGAGGKVTIYNGVGSTDVVADVNGWFTDSSIGGTGSRFTPVTPARILDSRNGTGGFTAPWGPNTGHPVVVAGQGGVPLMTDPNPPTAVVANITVTDTTNSSALVAWPHGAAQPLASDLNWAANVTVPNLAVVQVGSTGSVDLFNYAGCVDVVMDVVGWYTGPPVTAAAGPPPTVSPCPFLGKTWLARLNYWRATAGLPPLTENPAWSAGDYNHALWMVKNQTICHCETPGTPYYTTSGDYASTHSNIEVMSTVNFSDVSAIDWWMGAPFHAMGMMDPRLVDVGFGAYREVRSGWQAAFALNIISGNPFTGGTYPVYWPGSGTTVPLRSYSGNEIPNPLSACPGYAVPTGLPVFVQVGGNVATSVTVHSFTANGTPLAHCVIDSAHNPSLASYLTARGGVIVIPQATLSPGILYTVALTVNGLPYTWSFQVS